VCDGGSIPPVGFGEPPHMNRRKYILGVSSLATGSAAAVGTGAFSSVEADRDIRVEIADDTDAFLALVPTSEYAIEENGIFSLNLSPDNPTNAGGEGVNTNATTIIEDAFKIKKSGDSDGTTNAQRADIDYARRCC